MTLNIGSKKVSKLAIGQADGSVKNISQLNLGSNVIFKNSSSGAQFPLPSEVDPYSFYFGIPYIDEDKSIYGDPGYLRIYNPLESSYAKATFNVWYNKPYDRTPDFTTTILPNNSKNIDDLNFHFEQLTKNTLFQLKYDIETGLTPQDYFSYYYTNPEDGAIIRFADNNTSTSNLFRVVLSSMPSIEYFFTVNNTIYFINGFKGFNQRGSIYEMNSNCFNFPDENSNINNFRFNSYAFENFNGKGLLHSIPKNSFNTSKQVGHSNFASFNGVLNNYGNLQTNRSVPSKNYNTVMVNKNLDQVQIINANGQSVNIPVNESFEWYAN